MYYDDAPQVEERPWGEWRILHREAQTVVKSLTVNPGCMLSLQVHKNRDELWQPLTNGLVAYTAASPERFNPEAQLMFVGKVYRIRRGVPHRLINPTAHAITVIETITGEYDEDDIVRYHDAYGRV